MGNHRFVGTVIFALLLAGAAGLRVWAETTIEGKLVADELESLTTLTLDGNAINAWTDIIVGDVEGDIVNAVATLKLSGTDVTTLWQQGSNVGGESGVYKQTAANVMQFLTFGDGSATTVRVESDVIYIDAITNYTYYGGTYFPDPDTLYYRGSGASPGEPLADVAFTSGDIGKTLQVAAGPVLVWDAAVAASSANADELDNQVPSYYLIDNFESDVRVGTDYTAIQLGDNISGYTTNISGTNVLHINAVGGSTGVVGTASTNTFSEPNYFEENIYIGGRLIPYDSPNEPSGSTAAGTRAISLGWNTDADGEYSTIPGGRGNSVDKSYGAISGGRNNRIDGSYGAIAGGRENLIDLNANFSAIPGGESNTAGGAYSLAFGRLAKATNDETVVFSTEGTAWGSTDTNQFLIGPGFSVGIGTNAPSNTLHVAGDIRATTFFTQDGTELGLGSFTNLSLGDSNFTGSAEIQPGTNLSWRYDTGTNYFDVTGAITALVDGAWIESSQTVGDNWEVNVATASVYSAFVDVDGDTVSGVFDGGSYSNVVDIYADDITVTNLTLAPGAYINSGNGIDGLSGISLQLTNSSLLITTINSDGDEDGVLSIDGGSSQLMGDNILMEVMDLAAGGVYIESGAAVIGMDAGTATITIGGDTTFDDDVTFSAQTLGVTNLDHSTAHNALSLLDDDHTQYTLDTLHDTHTNDVDAHHTQTVDSNLTDEEVQDKAGAMWSTGTETGVSVTYDDVNAHMDIVAEVTAIMHNAHTNDVDAHHTQGAGGGGDPIDGRAATNSISPDADETYDVGSTSYRWRKLWVGDIDLTGALTGGDASDLGVDGSGFSGNLSPGEDSLQAIADSYDAYTSGGSPIDGRAATNDVAMGGNDITGAGGITASGTIQGAAVTATGILTGGVGVYTPLVDRATPGTVTIGAAIADRLELSKAGIETEIQGTLDVIQAADFDAAVTMGTTLDVTGMTTLEDLTLNGTMSSLDSTWSVSNILAQTGTFSAGLAVSGGTLTSSAHTAVNITASGDVTVGGEFSLDGVMFDVGNTEILTYAGMATDGSLDLQIGDVGSGSAGNGSNVRIDDENDLITLTSANQLLSGNVAINGTLEDGNSAALTIADNLIVTGSITGKPKTTTGGTAIVSADNHLYVVSSDSQVITLPVCAIGATVLIVNSGAYATVVTAVGDDEFQFPDGTLTTDNGITCSGDNAGQYASLVGISSSIWVVMGSGFAD